jgi:hypothetical protein
MPKLNHPPVPASTSKALLKLGAGKARFLQILKDDFNYDVIQEIIEMIGIIKRGKKLKPLDKYRLIQTYQLAILSYCIPKMKVLEGDKGVGDKINFTFNVGGEAPPNPHGKPVGGVNITIPTVKKEDGSFEPTVLE